MHPVAVQIARVTYLLALSERLRDPERPELAVPVYLGDALQWNVQGFLADREVLIEVPDGPVLHFPYAVTRSPADFDSTINLMLQQGETGAEPSDFRAALRGQLPGLDGPSLAILSQTYADLRDLRAQGRDHIWGFVARNLVRPVWLSSDDQRVDLVIGNPPWLAYRFMSRGTQGRFRKESQQLGVWQGGRFASHQDLSSYFFARCCELYLKPGGGIAFVMPWAALSRQQFNGFRSGVFAEHGGRSPSQNPVLARFIAAWEFSDDVQPLFPVPACVLFARVGASGDLPSNVRRASGQLPRRDADPAEAERWLAWRDAPWPAPGDDAASPYQQRFRQGATLVPRLLCLVEPAPVGPLGVHPQAPLVISRRSRQEKAPWRDLDSLTGNVERQFLRAVYLGASVAPFRLLEPLLGVIPWDPQLGLLDATTASRSGNHHLAAWMSKAEWLWGAHRSNDRLSFGERIDFHRELTSQLPPQPLRVVHSKSGSLMAAAIVTDATAVLDETLYGAPVRDLTEGRYLVAVLTSETLRRRIAPLQSRGQWGARDFSSLMWTLPIAEFDPANHLHAALAAAGRRAETVAAEVPLEESTYFITARRHIRNALTEDGVAEEINGLVTELLG